MASSRKSTILLDLKGTKFHETDVIDFDKAQALPDSNYIISRLLTMTKKEKLTIALCEIMPV